MKLSTFVKGAVVAASLSFASLSQAIVYQFDSVNGFDPNFRFSLLHGDADVDFVSGSGWYNDETNDFIGTFLLENADTLTLTGTLDFGVDGWLDSGSLDADFAADSLADTSFIFEAGDQTSSTQALGDPNSINDTFITLWGANADWFDASTSTGLGIDLRVELTETPLPSTLLLFGTGLVGLGAIRRRNKKA